MKIGLIDVDGHNWPNLALMKLSAWHKAKGDTVEWHAGWSHYDVVYMSKVFVERRRRMTKKEYEAKMAALEPLEDGQRKSITCSILGHSHITTGYFGYVYCARCGEEVGDQLLGIYYDPLEVRVGHNCPICRANYKKLDWKSKVLTPNPFV